jgi:hypothetical protein
MLYDPKNKEMRMRSTFIQAAIELPSKEGLIFTVHDLKGNMNKRFVDQMMMVHGIMGIREDIKTVCSLEVLDKSSLSFLEVPMEFDKARYSFLVCYATNDHSLSGKVIVEDNVPIYIQQDGPDMDFIFGRVDHNLFAMATRRHGSVQLEVKV